MNEKNDVQNEFLTALCKNRTMTAIYLINGIKLQGIITAFDGFTINLQEPTQQLISKGAIATVLPLEHEHK